MPTGRDSDSGASTPRAPPFWVVLADGLLWFVMLFGGMLVVAATLWGALYGYRAEDAVDSALLTIIVAFSALGWRRLERIIGAYHRGMGDIAFRTRARRWLVPGMICALAIGLLWGYYG
mgnify:FL=1